MKRTRIAKTSKVNNWLKHKETRDEIWDLMASKWAVRAENLANYGRSHVPGPVKTVLRKAIKQPLSSARKYQLNRKDNKEATAKPLQFSSAGK